MADLNGMATSGVSGMGYGMLPQNYAPTNEPNNNSTAEVCRDYSHGVCTRGSSCRFYHPPSHQPSATSSTTPTQQVCKDFLKGSCNRSSCRFLHPPQAPRFMPTYSGMPNPFMGYFSFMTPPTFGTPTPPTCKDFMNGKCSRANCKYFHGPYGMASTTSGMGSVMAPRGSVGTELCRDFAKGSCTRANCRFAHTESQHNSVEEDGTVLCKDFLNGACTRVACKFYHGNPAGKRSSDEELQTPDSPKRQKVEDQGEQLESQGENQRDHATESHPHPVLDEAEVNAQE